MADQDITASVDSRIDAQPIYGAPDFAGDLNGALRPPVANYVPLADTNVGGLSASEYEMQQAFARMDADQRAAAMAQARAEETARALRIAAEDPALQRGYFAPPREQPAYVGAAAVDMESPYGPVWAGRPAWEAPASRPSAGAGGGRFAALEIGDGPVELAEPFAPPADPIDPEAQAAAEGRPSLLSRLRARAGAHGGGMSEWSWGIGFGAMAVGQGLDRAITNAYSGNYIDPEVAQAQTVGSLLPGIGSAVGTGLGMLVPGIGGMGGQFIGQAVGQVGQTVWEATAGRNAAIRESGETFGGDMGAAAGAVKQFTDALEQAHAPVKQLAETLNQMTGTGPGVGVGSVGGADLMAGALGARFGAVTSGTEQFLAASPFLAGTLTRFNAAGSRLSPGEFGGLAELSALQGDWGGATNALSEMQAAESDPQYARDMADYRASETLGGWWHDVTHPSEVRARMARLRAGRRTGGLLPGAEAERERAAAAVARDYELSRGTQAGLLSADAGIGLAGQALSLGELSGASDVSGLAGGLYSSAASGLSVLGRQEGAIDAYLRDPSRTADERQAAQYQRALVEQEMGKLRLAEAQTRRALFDRGLQTEESGFSLDETRALYGGQSAAQMAGGVSRQAAYLSGVAADPGSPLTPAERRQLEAQGVSLRFQSAQAQYSQAEAGIGVEQAGAAANLSVARAYGGPGEVYSAQSGEARALLDLQRQLNDELEKGNLTYDQRLEKTRQVREITGEVASLESQARNAYFDSSASILSDSRGADAAGLGRSLAIHGSAGTDFGAVLGGDAREIANAQAAMAAARTPAERERWRRALAGLTEQQAGDVTSSQVFRQGAADQLADARATGAFGRAMSAPWADGTDPLGAGRNLLALREHDLADLQSWERTHHGDPLADLANARQEEQLRDQIASLRREQTTEAWRMLPEMIAGSPGRGVLAGVLPTSALSAFFTPGAMAGSWGMGGGGLSPAVPGGAAGHFDMAAGGSEAVSLLRQIADGINRLHGGVAGGRSTPVAPLTGQANYFNALGLNR